MSLYTPPSSEDFLPYVKYNAKAGRWYVKKDGTETEVQNPVFVPDLLNARKAWMYFAEGQAPDMVYFPDLISNVPKPSENHKLGVSVNLFSQNTFGGVAILQSCSINTCKALGELHTKYESAPESKKGMLPVVKVTGANPIKGNYGTNYEPVFVIEKWVDRPSAFDEAATSPEPENIVAEPQAPIVTSSVSEF